MAKAKGKTWEEILAPQLAEVMGFSVDQAIMGTCAALKMTDAQPSDKYAILSLVAKYKLDPRLKEIHALPTREKDKDGNYTGRIVYTASIGIDGWIKIANSHSEYDGYEVEHQDLPDETFVAKGKTLVERVCIVKLYRKDRKFPTVIEEYNSENNSGKFLWLKRARRMLFHRAFGQAVRYAFGVSGVFSDVDPSVPGDIEDAQEQKAEAEAFDNPPPESRVASLVAQMSPEDPEPQEEPETLPEDQGDAQEEQPEPEVWTCGDCTEFKFCYAEGSDQETPVPEDCDRFSNATQLAQDSQEEAPEDAQETEEGPDDSEDQVEDETAPESQKGLF